MKRIKLILIAVIGAVCFSAFAGNVAQVDSTQSHNLRPAAIMDKYKPYCNAGGAMIGSFLPAETYMTYGASGVSIIHELDGASGVAGTNTFNSTLTYSGANLVSVGCPVLQ